MILKNIFAKTWRKNLAKKFGEKIRRKNLAKKLGEKIWRFLRKLCTASFVQNN
jgi:hypothetical protein